MSECAAELCRNWTGQGCICAVMDIEPDVVDEHAEHDVCDGCGRCKPCQGCECIRAIGRCPRGCPEGECYCAEMTYAEANGVCPEGCGGHDGDCYCGED